MCCNSEIIALNRFLALLSTGTFLEMIMLHIVVPVNGVLFFLVLHVYSVVECHLCV